MKSKRVTAQNFDMDAGAKMPMTVDVTDERGYAVDMRKYLSKFIITSAADGPVLLQRRGRVDKRMINRLVFELTPADTSALAGDYHWKCEVFDDSTEDPPTKVAGGIVTIQMMRP